jgi:hypothetical protein
LQELLSQLEDNVQNVSSKAVSSEVLCTENREKIGIVQAKLEENQQKVEMAHTKIDANCEKIEMVQTKVNENREKIESVQKKFDESREKIQVLPTKLDSGSTDIRNQLIGKSEEINLKSLNPVPVVPADVKEIPKKSD